MAYVPGFAQDVFVSYAHGDDREWIQDFVKRLRHVVKEQLGVPPVIWLDDDSLRKSGDFDAIIPDTLNSSAILILLPSPTYVRSAYCVKECHAYRHGVADKQRRFNAPDTANEQFAFSCPIVAVENNEHRTLFPVIDINFFENRRRFEIDSTRFDAALAELAGGVTNVLKRMRNHLTPLFLYPHHPGRDLADVRGRLFAELTAHGYRVLPDREVNIEGQLREAAASVFLLGHEYDPTIPDLAQIASDQTDKPWVVWTNLEVEDATVSSSSSSMRGSARALGLARSLEQFQSATKTFLNHKIGPIKLIEVVRGLLKPTTAPPSADRSKPHVYVVYNPRDKNERANAGLVLLSDYKDVVHFDEYDDPALHTARMTRSDGVLLVWGSADLEWYTQELKGMMHAPSARARGVCLFQPEEAKAIAVRDSRQVFSELFITEQFGPFDAGRLDAFFRPLLQRDSAAP